jgi:tRNA pseudouridine55 synthase
MGGPDAKEYEAGIRFGFETTTDDAEGETRGDVRDASSLDSKRVSEALSAFVGEIQQVPPAFSAKKVAGERAYALARRGEDVDLKAETVQVGAAALLSLDRDVARVRFSCSRGTYIRALARDMGRALGVGAHLVSLRRTRSGAASLDRSLPLDDLTLETLTAALVPMISVLDTWPKLVVNGEQAADLRLGRAISVGRALNLPAGRVRVCDPQDGLIALASSEGSRVQPFCVF